MNLSEELSQLVLNPETGGFEHKDGTKTNVDFIDDWGGFDNKIVAITNEFGLSAIVTGCSSESCWSAWVDEQKTKPESDIIEAYGFYLMKDTDFFDNDSEFSYYIISEHKNHGTLTIGGKFKTKSGANEYALAYISEHEIELLEGYEYQNNSTDSGIVEIGHNTTMTDLTYKVQFSS